MTKTILVTGPDLHLKAAELVAQKGYQTVHTPPYADAEVIAKRLVETGAEGLVSRMGRIDASVMDAAPALKVISKHGVGVDNIDTAAAAERGIPVLVATGANAVSVAEHAIALMLATVKKLLPLDKSLREGRWEKPGFAGRELGGSTLGLVGTGSIAQATARMAKGLGMKLAGYDPFAPQEVFDGLGMTRCDSFEALLPVSDVLSLHCPLTAETRGILDADAIAKLPTGAYVVNTARGGLIDEAALVEALKSGHLAGAGLDSFATEPPAADHPFWDVSTLVVTPHIGGVTAQASARVGVTAVQGIFDVLEGRPIPPSRIVNRAQLAQPRHPLVEA
ncbi:hydroxyacid dehydrogenase [Tropicimonas sp. IMCC6043]|uniref:hydroxyacid dehydrogenase n=1 Tax=Tropicimonas sp. IMCC6043 TaxID=2510645 RepID=UPI00101C71D2|nr:hydroxyacid dehydrogenase [Tropicimonas sp. IMCC6043]RYH06564.1 hydroxyacid dehydrogenase [Tropicimonas sp. IMCC6043]